MTHAIDRFISFVPAKEKNDERETGSITPLVRVDQRGNKG